MTERRLFILAHPEARRRAIAAVQEAPDGFAVDVKPRSRTLDQNAKFHALCADLERSRFVWAGKPRTAAAWKVLLVSGHAVLTKDGSEMVPGLEDEFVNLRESTARMNKARGSSLIEYTLAFMASNNLKGCADAWE